MAQPGSARNGGGQDGGDEYASVVATSSSSSGHEASKYVTASVDEVQTAAAIEKSKEQGWSEVADRIRECAAGASWAGGLSEEDQLLWKKLKEEAPNLFVDWGERVQLGRLIAEGGQAHIHEATMGGYERQFPWRGGYVAKVFKMEGFSLVDLHRQWPRTKKQYYGEERTSDFYAFQQSTLGEVVFSQEMCRCSYVRWATFLEDGRFTLLAFEYWGDLRALINLKIKDSNHQGPPFTHYEALKVMHDIARGMRSLHGRGILHRDLKAANVLVQIKEGDKRNIRRFSCDVADYESSMLVQGTGLWRDPEVLEELLKKPHDRSEGVWTEKVDLYSYAMTCYEVLTGHTPFVGYVKSDWKRVIDGERPHLPDYVHPKLRELVEKCWHKVPSERPTFESIVDDLGGMLVTSRD